MSCRTTPAGSLATTFIQRGHDLEDGQCTSLFHELRRVYNNTPEEIRQPVGENEYTAVLSRMGTRISTSHAWASSPAMQSRALARFANAMRAGLPSDPAVAWATMNIDTYAAQVRGRLDQLFRETALAHNIGSLDAVKDEFRRLYKEYRTVHRDNPVTTDLYVSHDRSADLTQDPATQYARGAMRNSQRCFICGQFLGASGTSHVCPPANARPLLAPPAPTPPLATVIVDSPPTVVPPPRARLHCDSCGWMYWEGNNHSCSECYSCDSYFPDDVDHDCSGNDWDDDDDNDYDRRPPRPVERVSSPIGDETRLDEVPEVYLRNPVDAWDIDAFQDMYDAARARISEGNHTIPAFENPQPGEVTGGLGAREGGNSFGIELEIDFPNDSWPYNARQQFARRLHEEGIVNSPSVERWHYVGDDRPGGTFVESADGWICEFDRSVDDVDGERGVEIKSQILYDEPRTWHNIKRITEIARELGGAPTMRTGLHVNVGGGNFSSTDPTSHNALLRLAAAYDDTLVRMAHNPQSGPKHRGRAFCGFAGIPANGYQEVSSARAYSNHYQAFNLNHLPAAGERHRNSSRVEVRVWDSTLDEGRIQAAVTTSLAMVQLGLEDVAPGQGPERAGSHRSKFGRSKLSGEQWEESTAAFRRFVTLLDKAGAGTRRHREAFTAMFAASRWQER